jgi:hypothetical protein
MTYDWTNITEKHITNLIKEGYMLLNNNNHEYTDGPSDQFILVKNKN